MTKMAAKKTAAASWPVAPRMMGALPAVGLLAGFLVAALKALPAAASRA